MHIQTVIYNIIEPTTPLQIEEKAHQAFASSISIKEKVEIFRSTERHLKEWQQEPTLPSSVSDEYTTQNIEVPLSAITSWHYFQQLYSGGYVEESRDHLSVKLPPGYTISTFKTLLNPIDIKESELSFENFLELCSLASFFGSTTSFKNYLGLFEPSLKNIALLPSCDALPTFAPYKEAVSSMIKYYIRLTPSFLADLRELEGFREWAETFPIDLELDDDNLDNIGRLFPNTDSLEVFGPNITKVPESFSNIHRLSAFHAQNLRDISALNKSKELVILELERTKISSLPSNCPHLKKISLHRLTDIKEIPKDYPSLEELHISHCNGIKDLSSLDGSTTIRKLEFKGRASEMRFPERCPNLEIKLLKG